MLCFQQFFGCHKKTSPHSSIKTSTADITITREDEKRNKKKKSVETSSTMKREEEKNESRRFHSWNMLNCIFTKKGKERKRGKKRDENAVWGNVKSIRPSRDQNTNSVVPLMELSVSMMLPFTHPSKLIWCENLLLPKQKHFFVLLFLFIFQRARSLLCSSLSSMNDSVAHGNCFKRKQIEAK